MALNWYMLLQVSHKSGTIGWNKLSGCNLLKSVEFLRDLSITHIKMYPIVLNMDEIKILYLFLLKNIFETGWVEVRKVVESSRENLIIPSPIVIFEDNLSIVNISLYTIALEWDYEITVSLNMHAMNFKNCLSAKKWLSSAS